MDAFVEQLTEQQAIAFADSGVWKDWDAERIVKFQLFQERLCMDWATFQNAVGEVLGRPVWTHEFGTSNYPNLVREYLKIRPQPTLEEIMDLIPEDKRTVILEDTP